MPRYILRRKKNQPQYKTPPYLTSDNLPQPCPGRGRGFNAIREARRHRKATNSSFAVSPHRPRRPPSPRLVRVESSLLSDESLTKVISPQVPSHLSCSLLFPILPATPKMSDLFSLCPYLSLSMHERTERKERDRDACIEAGSLVSVRPADLPPTFLDHGAFAAKRRRRLFNFRLGYLLINNWCRD